MKDPSKCKYKHEKCKAPLPEGWRKKGKGKGKGKSRSGSPRVDKPANAEPRERKPKSEIPCWFHQKGKCTKGEACEYKHS